MNNTMYNEWLDTNYLSADFPTDEEMEILKEYYKKDIEINRDKPEEKNIEIWN